jgi:hypothetical protein
MWTSCRTFEVGGVTSLQENEKGRFDWPGVPAVALLVGKTPANMISAATKASRVIAPAPLYNDFGAHTVDKLPLMVSPPEMANSASLQVAPPPSKLGPPNY